MFYDFLTLLGYSGADVRSLCTEAAMEPIRCCVDIRTMDANEVRPINATDFQAALRGVRHALFLITTELTREFVGSTKCWDKRPRVLQAMECRIWQLFFCWA